MDSDWVYRAEYSLSDRSSCKKCQNGIGRDVVRLAILQQSRFHDGKDCLWHHVHCFFQKKPNVMVDEIWHFHDLRWKDQERIRKHAEGKGKGKKGDVSSDESAESEEDDDDEDELPKKKSKRGKKQNSSSKKKAKKSDKGKAGESEEVRALREQNEMMWAARDELAKLPVKAQKELLEANEQHVPVANKIMDRIADMLVFGATEKCDQCSHNGHLVISADGYHCIGSVDEWAKCDVKTQTPRRKAHVIPESLLDKHSFLSEYSSFKPRSRIFPSCFKLSQSNGVNGDAKATNGSSSNGTSDEVDGPSTSKDNSKSEPKKFEKTKDPSEIKVKADKPLANLRISAVGTLSVKRADLTKKIANLGGLYVSKVSKDTFVLVSDEKSIAQRPVTLEMAEVCKVHVVPVDFITDLEDKKKVNIKTQRDLIDFVERSKINPWTASTVVERINQNKIEAASFNSALSSTEQHKAQERVRNEKWNSATEAKMKVLVKNGGVVDGDADLDEETHSVFRQDDILYSFVLAKSSVVDGTNSFYKMQIVKHDKQEVYYLFRAWGRIGTVIGGTKCEEMDKDEAIEGFEYHFLDKTGNEWKDKDKFVKKHGKYFQLQLDYGPQEAEEEYAVQPGSKTKLRKEIQEVIKMIFDVEEMRKTMKEFEIDSRKMPLGKLSKKQILEAMAVLGELQGFVDAEERPNAPKIIGATNRFFTLIPHDYGVHAPPVLNNSALLKDKLDMLENLMEIEVAFNILRGENRASDQDPIDQKYEKLNCGLEVLDKETKEYKHIAKYISNTHASTHSNYQLKLVDVFKVVREGEAQRFDEFKALHNHKLLWHGSRVTNYAGILSQGLRIAPPEAPVTGYMFGKGVYFADMVSKSANYCATSRNNPTGLMLLSDVALGNMYELTEAKSITRLPKDFHSVKGCGKTEPKAEDAIVAEDGVEIPLGRPTDSTVKKNTTLLYNEYIVYKEAQVHIRYLLKVQFQYK